VVVLQGSGGRPRPSADSPTSGRPWGVRRGFLPRGPRHGQAPLSTSSTARRRAPPHGRANAAPPRSSALHARSFGPSGSQRASSPATPRGGSVPPACSFLARLRHSTTRAPGGTRRRKGGSSQAWRTTPAPRGASALPPGAQTTRPRLQRSSTRAKLVRSGSEARSSATTPRGSVGLRSPRSSASSGAPSHALRVALVAGKANRPRSMLAHGGLPTGLEKSTYTLSRFLQALGLIASPSGNNRASA